MTKEFFLLINILIIPNVLAHAQQNFPHAPEIWSEPVILDTVFARPYALQVSASFTSNIDTAYFEGGTGIYMSYKKDGKWTSRIKLNNNINDVNIAYRNPSISKDGKRLYFSAWKGYGGWDIWYSDWNKQTNDWGEAYNMGPVINNADDQMYLYEVNKDSVFCLSYNETDLYAWNHQENTWVKADSSWYHELGVGDKYGLSMTGNKKKIYFGKLFAYKHLDGKPIYNMDIFVTYWDSTKDYWGDVYSLNINTEPKLYPDSSLTYGGGEYDPWISPDGKVLIFTSDRDAVYDSVNTDDTYKIFISYLLEGFAKPSINELYDNCRRLCKTPKRMVSF